MAENVSKTTVVLVHGAFADASGWSAEIGYLSRLGAVVYIPICGYIERVLADGDLVVTHAEVVLVAGQPGRAVADFWRLDEGKVFEHWDVVQDVPEISADANGMFQAPSSAARRFQLSPRVSSLRRSRPVSDPAIQGGQLPT